MTLVHAIPSPATPVTIHPRYSAVAAPLEALTIPHPHLPPELSGLRILHISDLHLRRGADGSDIDAPRQHGMWWRDTLDAIASVEVDLALFTGDWCDHHGQEAFAARGLVQLARACRASLGCYGIFGNHDNPNMRRLAIAQSGDSGIIWLGGRAIEPTPQPAAHLADRQLPNPQLPHPRLRLLGLDFPEDPLGTLAACGLDRASLLAPFTLTLAHRPSVLLHGAQLGLPLIFAGHTHGGQVRLPLHDVAAALGRAPWVGPRLRRTVERFFGTMIVPHTSSDLPGELASGATILGETMCSVSRGLGDSAAELIRFGCPRHVPLYTLVCGQWPDAPVPLRVVKF